MFWQFVVWLKEQILHLHNCKIQVSVNKHDFYNELVLREMSWLNTLYLMHCQYLTLCSGSVKITGELWIGKHVEAAEASSTYYSTKIQTICLSGQMVFQPTLKLFALWALLLELTCLVSMKWKKVMEIADFQSSIDS